MTNKHTCCTCSKKADRDATAVYQVELLHDIHTAEAYLKTIKATIFNHTCNNSDKEYFNIRFVVMNMNIINRLLGHVQHTALQHAHHTKTCTSCDGLGYYVIYNFRTPPKVATQSP